MLELLFVIVGAAIALFSYHMGRNNRSSLPAIPNPFIRQTKPDNGASEAPKPVSRGM